MTCQTEHPSSPDIRCQKPLGHGSWHFAITAKSELSWCSDYTHVRRLPAALTDGRVSE